MRAQKLFLDSITSVIIIFKQMSGFHETYKRNWFPSLCGNNIWTTITFRNPQIGEAMKTDSNQPLIQNHTVSRDLSLHQDSLYQAFVLDSLWLEKNSQIQLSSEPIRSPDVARIEKGMDPSSLDVPHDESSRKFGALRWGMLLMGAGFGLLIGLMIVELLGWWTQKWTHRCKLRTHLSSSSAIFDQWTQ